MAKEHTGHQLVLITTSQLGVQTGTMTAGGLVAMVANVNMIMCLPMHETLPNHSILNVALMHILDTECTRMALCIVTCLQSLQMMNPGGAVAGTVRQ